MPAANQVNPLVTEAFARWQAAGMDTLSFHGIDVRIADLGGATRGLATGNTIYLGDSAAGWGWSIDPTPWDGFEFNLSGDQGEQDRMDLLAVVLHEMGHVLGLAHNDHDDDEMFETLAAGVQRASVDHVEEALASLVPSLRINWREAF